MAYKPRFGKRQREDLWAREVLHAHRNELGPHPICNLCGLPVTPDQAWDESHAGAPKCFGGKITGIAHMRCNREHGLRVVKPAADKARRVRQKYLGIDGPGLGRHPMEAGRRSNVTKTFSKGLQPRLTLKEKHALFLKKRAIVPLDQIDEVAR